MNLGNILSSETVRITKTDVVLSIFFYHICLCFMLTVKLTSRSSSTSISFSGLQLDANTRKSTTQKLPQEQRRGGKKKKEILIDYKVTSKRRRRCRKRVEVEARRFDVRR